jgi:Protein of unknown function (DUF4065)
MASSESPPALDKLRGGHFDMRRLHALAFANQMISERERIVMPTPRPHEQPTPKLAHVLHYIISRTVGLDFGEVKINKAVVAADSESYRRYGETITGAQAFQKQQFGPVPNGVLKALAALRRAGKISPNPVPTPAGERQEYVALAEPDLSVFTAQEIDVINLAISGLQRISAVTASNRTHDALWDETPMFGQISIPAAAFQPSEVISADVLSWALSDRA